MSLVNRWPILVRQTRRKRFFGLLKEGLGKCQDAMGTGKNRLVCTHQFVVA